MKVDKRRWCGMAVAAMGILLAACGTTVHHSPRTYAQSLDSATSACRRNPTACVPQAGEQLPTVPPPPAAQPAAPLPPALSGAESAALSIAAAGRVIQIAIDAALKDRIRKALSECADEARSEMILKYFGGRGPTHSECAEVVGTDSNGDPLTRAMQLGIEQHELALRCAEEKLQELKPGGFSLSARYRAEPGTGNVQYLSRDQVKELLESGRSAELRGTIEPDIVIHEGNPLRVQLIFDFKFPCVNGGEPRWREYPAGHPHQFLNQKDVYEALLRAPASRIIPRVGVRP